MPRQIAHAGAPHTQAHGVYVHAPWCRRRCAYCAFATRVDPAPPFRSWVSGVQAEWGMRRAQFPGEAHSVYFGGGTPSLIPTPHLRAVLDTIPHARDAEVTIEANPGTVTPQVLQDWLNIGINRVSLGVQTFHPAHARLLNRAHTVGQARALAHAVSAAGFRSWSLDLIFALPNQTIDDVRADLDEIGQLAPPHVSLYALSYEPGTPLTAARDAGRLQPADDDAWHTQYTTIVDTLRAQGLHRYEVSNFAAAHHQGVHNGSTWRGGYYAGLGPSAHGFEPTGRRTINHPDLEGWLHDPIGDADMPSAHQAAVDLILSSLRHTRGLDLELLRSRTGYDVDELGVSTLVNQGVVHHIDGHIRLAPPGWAVADGVGRHLVRHLQQLPSALDSGRSGQQV